MIGINPNISIKIGKDASAAIPTIGFKIINAQSCNIETNEIIVARF
jgi:hypothetical protein